jgi:hypothetical protein
MSEQRSRPTGPPVIWLSLGAFLVVLAILAIRMSRGEDPGVGAGQSAPPVATVRRVLVRRIIKRVVVTDVIPPPVVTVSASPGAALAAPAASPAVSAAAPAQSSAPAPVAAAPAPVAAAPAPPPPAPAPAPVTRTS